MFLKRGRINQLVISDAIINILAYIYVWRKSMNERVWKIYFEFINSFFSNKKKWFSFLKDMQQFSNLTNSTNLTELFLCKLGTVNTVSLKLTPINYQLVSLNETSYVKHLQISSCFHFLILHFHSSCLLQLKFKSQPFLSQKYPVDTDNNSVVMQITCNT